MRGPVAAVVLAATLLARGARGEQAVPYLGAAVEVRQVAVDPDQRRGDVRGLGVSLRYRVGRLDADRALYLAAHLGQGAGRVRALAGVDRAYRDQDGLLHAKAQLVAVPRNVWREARLFIPYFAMDLGPGDQRVSLLLSALSNAGSCGASGRGPAPVEVVGESRVEASFSRPPSATVRLVVRRLEVDEEPTDVALPRSRRGRPDLRWRLSFRADREVALYTSATRADTYAGSWAGPGASFPMAQGDRLTLSVLDQDLVRDDLLGRLTLSLEQLRGLSSASAQGQEVVLEAGGARRIVLGPVQVQP